MKKIAGYDDIKAITKGESNALPAGAYPCRIINAKEEVSKNGNPMLVLSVDIAHGEYKDYFKNQYKARKETNAEAKWLCNFYQRLDGNNLSYFKGMIHAIEDSNAGYEWNWDEKSLINLMFVGVFQRQEVEFSNGETGMVTRLIQIRSFDALDEGRIKIPEDKMLAANSATKKATPEKKASSIFDDDDLPF